MIKLFRKDVRELVKENNMETVNDLINWIKEQEDDVSISDSAERLVDNSLGSFIGKSGQVIKKNLEYHTVKDGLIETSDLLFADSLIDAGDGTFSKGRERVAIKRLTEPTDKINMSFGEFTRSGIFKNEYVIKPPRDFYDEYMPSCKEPGRVINRIEDDDGELEDIRIYNNHDISEDVIEKNSYVPTAPELAAVLGVIWQIREYGVKGYLQNMIRRLNEKMENGNEWTCSSCRYCNRRTETIENSKKMSKERDVTVCGLTDIVIAREDIQQEGEGYVISNSGIWSETNDGLFNAIALKDGADNKVGIECPFHDKNYKSKKLDKWITEKPRPVLPITCEGDKFIVLLEDIEVDITEYVKDEIKEFFTEDYGIEITDKRDKEVDEVDRIEENDDSENNENVNVTVNLEDNDDEEVEIEENEEVKNEKDDTEEDKDLNVEELEDKVDTAFKQ